MSAGRAVLLLILVATAVRLILAGSTGLGIDEAYMVGNARVLSMGYVDHPPLHVWIAGLAARFFGTETALAVRLPFILLFAGSTWLLYQFTRDLFGKTAGFLAALSLTVTPVFSVADGSWVLPDGPLIFFLLAAAVVTARILFAETSRRHATLIWIGAGVLGGLALLSKYNAIFFFAGVFGFLVTTSSARRFLATPGPWLGVAAAALLFLPVVFWNVQTDFAGMAFQGNRFVSPAAPGVTGFLVNLAGQAAYLTPWLFLFLLYGLARALRAGPADPRGWFCALLALGPIVVFAILAFRTRSLPHWPMPGWLFTLPLLGREAARLLAEWPRVTRGATAAAAGVFVVLLAAVIWQATRGGLLPADQRAHRDPTVDLVDWTALREALAARGFLASGVPIAARDWITAGKASYALGPDVPVLCLCADPHHFRFRSDPGAYAGRDAVVVFPAYEKERALASLAPHFDSLAPLESVEVQRGGKTVLTLDVMLGRNLGSGERQ